MKLRSLGLRTDLALIDGERLDRDTYLVVRSPGEPGYYWGNLLIFSAPPGDGDFASWEDAFEREFADLPRVAHRTFTWDCGSANAAVIGDFLQAGYHQEKTLVLTASAVKPPPHPNAAIEIRALHSDADWQAAAEVQVACRDAAHEEGAYRNYLAGRLAGLRVRVASGHGEWYGAFREGQQVANLGIFRSGAIARFQIVATHPSARREGICGTLVHQVAQATLDRGDVETLVMLADSEYHAARIYESVGFAASESLEGLCRWP